MKRALLAALVAMMIVGCDTAVNPRSGTPDQTDGRITVINDEGKLAGRVTVKSEPVPVDTSFHKAGRAVAFGLELVAEIAPPVVNGTTLQATSVVLNGNFAYVSYNVQGNSCVGAIDVIQVKGVKNATIRSEAMFNDTKVSSVAFDNNSVYLAEATNNPSFASPAVIEVIAANGGKLDLTKHFQRSLSSYVATSVFAGGGKVYVTSGNTGGLYSIAQNDTLTMQTFTALSDARWVDCDASNVVVAQGTTGQISVFNRAPGTLAHTWPVAGMTIPESKSTVRIIGGKALVAAGDGGVKLLDLATGTVVGSIPRTVVAGLDPSLTVTNAVDATGQFVYISNGEGGIYVALAGQALENGTGTTPIALTVLGRLQFAAHQSVNHVAFDGSTLAIASGLGGVRFITFTL